MNVFRLAVAASMLDETPTSEVPSATVTACYEHELGDEERVL